MLAVRLAIILSFLAMGLAAVYIFTMERPQPIPRGEGEALIGGPFALTTHTGEAVTDQSFEGKALLVYFGFTFCPDICPTDLQKLSAALDQLSAKERSKIVPLFITIDPERDTVDAMADYVGHFHPDLIGLTGTPAEIKQAADAYRAYYEKVEDDSSTAGYTMSHSNLIYVMDQNHKFVTVITKKDGPDKIVSVVKDLH